MSSEKEYLQDYEVRSVEVDQVEEDAKLNKEIIKDQVKNKFSATKENVLEDVVKNEEVNLDEYFE